jgi:signal transduction histidine kinase/CheY-like chemotaxis protein
LSENHPQGDGIEGAENSSRGILIQGFGFISLVIVIMAVVWFFMITETQKQIDEIIKDQEEAAAVSTMRDSVYQRALILHRMALMEDEFDRDDEYIRFKEKAGDFIKARDFFLGRSQVNHDSHPEKLAIWEGIKSSITKGGNWQTATSELLVNGEDDKANETLLHVALPAQNRTIGKLNELSIKQREITNATLEKISEDTQSSLTIMSGLAISAVLWAFGIAAFTIRKTSRVEASLNEARENAQNADKHKSQFLANMSHEIRTPLTAIIGFSETLIDGNEKSNDWKLYLRSIIRNGKHLHELINDILDISKIEANQLSMEHIDVSPGLLLFEIDSLLRERAISKGLHFEVIIEYPIPETITSDPTRLKQILINLCSNAIKFTADGRVTLRSHYNKETNQFGYTIEDSGIGMSSEQISELFKPFKQADSSTTREFGGTGLGLYISKQLAENLGGSLTVDSLQGVGSRFSVLVDAGTISDEAWINSKEEALNRSSSSRNKADTPSLNGNILLAEDNPDNQRLISMHINKTGAKVTVVGNGKLAVEKGLSESFDLIIMDMQMPIMGGIDAIKALRASGCETPIATLTANAMKEDIQESKQAGAREFLTKPIDRKAFYAMLQNYLDAAKPAETEPTKKQTSSDLDGIEDLIELYIESLPEACGRIERLLHAKDWDGLRFEIHQLKGTGGAFGFPEITEQCKEIESKMKNKEYDEATQLISGFHLTCGSIVAANSNTEAA